MPDITRKSAFKNAFVMFLSASSPALLRWRQRRRLSLRRHKLKIVAMYQRHDIIGLMTSPSADIKPIIFSQHALGQLLDRGATESGVKKAITEGEEVPAKRGRRAFRKNFSFDAQWKGKRYDIKQVMPIVIKEPARWVVITVYVFYFGGEKR